MKLQRGDVVLVPFPFTDLTRQKARPAVVVSTERFNTESADVIVVGISSKLPAAPENSDLIVQQGSPDFQATGLRVSSVILPTKLVTLQQPLIYTTLGRLETPMVDRVDERLAQAVGLRQLGDEITARMAAEARVRELTDRVHDLERRLSSSEPDGLP